MKTAALILACILALGAGAAWAEDAGAARQPPATDVQGEGSLSDKLSRSGGEIHPAENADPGLAKAPPPTGVAPMPVIPPPGSPGGDPTVRPK